MNIEFLLQVIRKALEAIVDPRYYNTERGFQGRILAELHTRIAEVFPEHCVIIEQEHQKTRRRHGITLRPDIIVHQPFDPTIHGSRCDGNFAVIALKLRAGPRKAAQDFENLLVMLDELHYTIGVFINVDHTCPQIEHVPAQAAGRIVAFATKLTQNGVCVVEARA